MLPQSVIDAIRELLAQGDLSQRKIALRLGVGRGTVAAVASGRRKDHVPPRPDEDDELPQRGPVGRCPSCGGWVHLPCRLCLARQRIARRRLHQRRPIDLRPQEPIRLELRGAALRRYRAVHARRMRQGELGEEDRDEEAAMTKHQ